MMSDIKSQAKSSRNSKLHALGGKGTVGKQLSTSAGSTWDGQAGVDSGQIADEQKVKTRKDGGRVGGSAMKPRLDRKARASGGSTSSDSDDKRWQGEPKRIPRSSQPPSGGTTVDDLVKEMGGKNKGGRVERASGGKVSSGKGKTNITIVMAPGQGGSQAPQAVPVPRPVPIPVQAPPPGAAPPMGAGAPSMAPPPAPPPSGLGRKAGGRVTVGKGLGMTAGGGGGEGRLQKAKMQKRTYP